MEERLTEYETSSSSPVEIIEKLVSDLDHIGPEAITIERIRWWRARGLTAKSRILNRAELDSLERQADEILQRF